jgi:hypothetical protein
MLAMSSGSIRPIRCAAAIFVTRGLPASNRPRTRSVMVAAGAMALTRTFWGANSTAIDRVIAAIPPFGGVAIEASNAHQRDVRGHVDHRSSTRGDDRRDTEAASEERTEQVKADRTPEFLDRCFDHRVVSRGRSSGIVMQNVQAAVVLRGGVDRGPHAIFLAHVGRDCNAMSTGLDNDLRRLLAGCGVQFGNDNLCSVRSHGPRRRAANTSPGTGDQCDFPVQPCHGPSPVIR